MAKTRLMLVIPDIEKRIDEILDDIRAIGPTVDPTADDAIGKLRARADLATELKKLTLRAHARYALSRGKSKVSTITAIFAVLADAGETGLTTLEILDRVRAIVEWEVPRGTVSSTLSRLGRMGRLRLTGERWSLDDEAEE